MKANRHIDDVESFKEELAHAFGIRTYQTDTEKRYYIMPKYLYSKLARTLFSSADDIVLDRYECIKVFAMLKDIHLDIYQDDLEKLRKFLMIAVNWKSYLIINSNGDLLMSV